MSSQTIQYGSALQPKPQDRGLRNVLVGAVITTATSLFVFGPPGAGSFDPPITNSQNGKVPRVVQLTGWQITRPDADLHNLFVLVTSPSGKIYPQGKAVLEPGGLSCLITLGRAGKHGHADPADDGDYEVDLVIANPAAASVLMQYVRHRSNDPNGLGKDYPATGIRSIAHETLHRSSTVKETLTRPHPENGCSR